MRGVGRFVVGSFLVVVDDALPFTFLHALKRRFGSASVGDLLVHFCLAESLAGSRVAIN